MSNPNLNQNLSGLSISSTFRIKQACKERTRQGKTVYDFGLGASPFPIPEIVVNALKAYAHEKEYLPCRGLMALRESISSHIKTTQNIGYEPRNIIIGPGSKELLFLLNIAYAGEIWILAPAWVSYEPQAQISGHKKIVRCITRVEDNWKLTPQLLKQYLKQDLKQDSAADKKPYNKLIILNYPANPHGNSYTRSELTELVKIFEEEQFIIVSDEIYGKMHFEGGHVSIAQLYPQGTIMCGGISKWCGAGGWRLGAMAIPEQLSWLGDAIEIIASESFSSTCAPVQYAAISAFEDSTEINEYIQHVRRILKKLMYAATDILRAGGFSIKYPDGAYYLFVDFTPFTDRLALKGITTGEQLADHLMTVEGVASLPGSDFGLPIDSLTLRLSIIDFDGKQALEESKRIGLTQPLDSQYVSTYFSHCFNGLHKLVELVK